MSLDLALCLLRDIDYCAEKRAETRLVNHRLFYDAQVLFAVQQLSRLDKRDVGLARVIRRLEK